MKEKEWTTVDIEKHGVITPGHPNFDLDWYLKFLCRDIEKEMNNTSKETIKSVTEFIKSYKKEK